MHFVGKNGNDMKNVCNIKMVVKGRMKIVDFDAVSQAKVGTEKVNWIFLIEMEFVHLGM